MTDWKRAQKEDPALYAVVKHLRGPRFEFKQALKQVVDEKSARAYLSARDNMVMRDGLLYHKIKLKATGEELWRFVVPKLHHAAALDGCHREAAHQGQRHTFSLVQERFWWPGVAREIRNKVKNCARCLKFGGTSPIAKLQKLPCSGPGELLHIDYTTIEETVDLHEKPVLRNVLVMQDHFSKHVVAYVVKDQTARTAAETLRKGYFSLFGAPAYLLSDRGAAFTGHVIRDLCKLYGVQKLRTSSYHAQTNGQVERMNQTLIRMIGKLEDDKKAQWSKFLPELLLSYNATRSAVTGYSPHFLYLGRRPRIPVDYQFPTIRDPPHKAKMEESVAELQKRLKEAFEVARHITSEEAVKQQRYYDRKAGAVALQPEDVVMVRTDRFVGKRKVKDRWEEGGFVVVKQLGDWPVYRVQCPPTGNQRKPQYRILHRNRLMLVPPGDDTSPDTTQLAAAAAIVSNAYMEIPQCDGESTTDSERLNPTLLTRQVGDQNSRVWLNGEFCTPLYTQTQCEASQSPPDSIENEISDSDPVFSGSDEEEA